MCNYPMCQAISLLIPPYVIQFWEEKVGAEGLSTGAGHSGCRAATTQLVLPLLLLQAKSYGPIASGALFGAGWWFWVDAVVCTTHKIPFDQVGAEGKAGDPTALACCPRLPSQVSADKMKASTTCPGAAADVRMGSLRSRQCYPC